MVVVVVAILVYANTLQQLCERREGGKGGRDHRHHLDNDGERKVLKVETIELRWS